MLKKAMTTFNTGVFLALLCVVWQPSPSSAAEAKKSTDLKVIERALDKGKKRHENLKKQSVDLGRDLNRLRAETVKVASAIQDHEITVLDLEVRLKDLTEKEKSKLVLLGKRREQFGHVLMALLRMVRHPPEAMIAAPISPSDTVRGTILLRAAVPAIEERATDLRQELSELVSTRQQAVQKRQQLAAVRTDLDFERKRLNGLMKAKTKLKKKTDSQTRKAEKRVRELVKKAKSLRDLMARLEADRKKRKKAEPKKDKQEKTEAVATKLPIGSISKSRGTLPYPAIGRLVGRYGQAMETGLTRKGITIETGVEAQVVVPYNGTVVFAGAFKGYGQLLIIEHGEGYHSLLAGLARIDNAIGQQVLSGEPAGIMGSPKSGLPVLYVELRRNGQPINPLPWLAARKIKING
ncbi:MAG: peptidoglycan DD-metalloendopeptidase family protein [Rhodospirillales bacterium]|nr:peptidoglycan DD-metalloendopeptidase family protein [Rhodospirillales bacterium]